MEQVVDSRYNKYMRFMSFLFFSDHIWVCVKDGYILYPVVCTVVHENAKIGDIYIYTTFSDTPKIPTKYPLKLFGYKPQVLLGKIVR